MISNEFQNLTALPLAGWRGALSFRGLKNGREGVGSLFLPECIGGIVPCSVSSVMYKYPEGARGSQKQIAVFVEYGIATGVTVMA